MPFNPSLIKRRDYKEGFKGRIIRRDYKGNKGIRNDYKEGFKGGILKEIRK
jgi:uncharacterized protein YihD (DUF1040 family)